MRMRTRRKWWYWGMWVALPCGWVRLCGLRRPAPRPLRGGWRACPRAAHPQLPNGHLSQPFHPRMRTVPVCSVGDTTEAEMKGYGLAALVPLATVHLSPPSGGAGDTGVPGRGTKGVATAHLQIELSEFNPKNLPEWAEGFSEFFLLTGQQHADVRTKCTLIKKLCKSKKFLQRQVRPLSGTAPTGATS